MRLPKPAAQLDAEIAATLSESRQRTPSQRHRMSKLQPVEGLWIPAASRDELISFWQSHPALRQGCLRKYGFDPIDDEASYWRFGLAEPDHQDVLRGVRRNANNFALALVKRWEIEELKDAKSEKDHRSEGARTAAIRPKTSAPRRRAASKPRRYRTTPHK